MKVSLFKVNPYKIFIVSLCNRLLYAKQIVIEKEPVKEEDITLLVISTRKEFGWRIVRTQFIDIAVKLQDSYDLQIGETITVTVSLYFTKKQLIHPIRFHSIEN